MNMVAGELEESGVLSEIAAQVALCAPEHCRGASAILRCCAMLDVFYGLRHANVAELEYSIPCSQFVPEGHIHGEQFLGNRKKPLT